MLQLYPVYLLWNRRRTLTGPPDPTLANGTNELCPINSKHVINNKEDVFNSSQSCPAMADVLRACVLSSVTMKPTTLGHFYRTHCKLQEVPHNIPKIVSHVFLSNNNITTIKPRAFSRLNKCTFLALSKNHRSKITQQMFSGLASVEIMLLDNNQIFYIEYEAFSTLSRLVDVRLDQQ